MDKDVIYLYKILFGNKEGEKVLIFATFIRMDEP